MSERLDVLVSYVPQSDTALVLRALFEAGAGEIGAYRECAFITPGTGQFRPLAGANPTIGSVNELEYVAENRIEVTFPRRIRAQVVAALRAAHPYEEPAFHVVENVASHPADDSS
ncbi:hypothetical protein [Tessaracoccus sp. OH4464_COT-324]|uniref:hypothetical protein n=1 Tax=Tessaracoccus sp. OH4464_COT-324 TaxID=2491059 RepID=UPI000F62EBEB|nr:hypothetical protein [Tessaracoccus sp. OH4464_COT-324]RRD47987.1 hypothetical protein EII42_01720 [Tessaracoccus sp. OH4464_COT-324]